MQALYAYYQSENKDITRTEQELLNGTTKIYELYLMVLQFFADLAHQENMYYEDVPASAVTGQRRTAVHTLNDTSFIQWLGKSESRAIQNKKFKISWQQDNDAVKKAFHHLRQSDHYKAFISNDTAVTGSDDQFLIWTFKELFLTQDFIRHLLEERTIYWAESLDLAEMMFNRTVESGKGNGQYKLNALYKDEEDDVRFMRDLVQKTIRDDSYYQEMIADKTKNWDADRIALVDIILMKMALCEILNITNIPVKVSINEYIDISKDYSTPNSKSFINGVIDKLVHELREQGKINKSGRGLVE